MKKAITLMAILMVVLLAGCSLMERFKQAEEQYLETRVSELVEEMPAEVVETQPAMVEEPVATVEPKETEPTAEAEEPTETPEPEQEATKEVTEEPEEEETPEATEEATVEPTVEPTVESDDPAVFLGDPDWVDEMDQPVNWSLNASEYDLASFENGVLKIKALNDLPGWRIANTGSLSKVYIEETVKMGECAGIDSTGLIFRVQQTGVDEYDQGYFFAVTCDGKYSLRMWDGKAEKSVMLKTLTPSDLINKGKDQTNRLGVMTVGDSIMMYINGEQIGEVVDETYASGYFGVFINREKTEDYTIFVDQVSYWLDPEID